MRKINLLVFFAFCFTAIDAQTIQSVPLSPSASFSQTVGITDISMEYSRPGVRGRKIFGTGEDYLLQYGTIWRTGANAATQISFSTDVKVAGKDVPAGTYAIYTVPGASEWKFMLYKDLSVGGNTDNYKAEDELMAAMIKPNMLASKVESMTFGVNNISPDGTATLDLMWENSHISVPINTNADAMIMKQIDDAMDNPMSRVGSLYATAANYYYNNDKDLNKALEWISKACEINMTVTNYERKADIQAKLGKYKDAVATVNELHKIGAASTGNALNQYNNTVKPRVDAKAAEWKKKK